MTKISTRFFNDVMVRAVWDNDKWWFSVVDIIKCLNASDNPRHYWTVLKARLLKSGNQTVTNCDQFKLMAEDGKRRLTDCIPQELVNELVKNIPSKNVMNFLDWFTYSDNTIDGQSKKKAYSFWKNNLINENEIGKTVALKKIHAYIFGGLYDFAGKIRNLNISKGGFKFASAQFLHQTLLSIDLMPQSTFDEIVDKYVEMNVAHPFMEGNGRATRIWLDLIFKQSLKQCIDWSKINKKDYLDAMSLSPSNPNKIKILLKNALTDKINSREIFIKGIDYSYYYEEYE